MKSVGMSIIPLGLAALLVGLVAVPLGVAVSQESAGESAPPQAVEVAAGDADVAADKPPTPSAPYEVAAGEEVDGNVVTVDQAVHIRGEVNGSVFATRGEVHLYKGAEVSGDVVVSGGKLHREDGAEIQGSVVIVPAGSAAPAPAPKREPKPARELEPKPELPVAKQPAEEMPAPAPPVTHSDELVRFGEPVSVGPNEIVDGDLVSFGGPVDVDGKVRGDVVSFGGPVSIAGEVQGDAVSMGGPLSLADGSVIQGDAVAVGGPLSKSGNAVVHGSSSSVGGPFGVVPWTAISKFAGPRRVVSKSTSSAWRSLASAVAWVASTVLILLFGAFTVFVAPRATDTVASKIDEEPGRVFLYGVAGWLLVLPILFLLLVLVVTWVFVPVFVLAVALLLTVGCIGVSLYGGRRLAEVLNWRVRSLLGLTVVGLLALRMAGLVSVLPFGEFLAGALTVAVLTMGLGAALMTRFGTDPTGRWLGGRAAVAAAGGPSVHPPPGPGPPPPVHNEHDLDDETLEALSEVPPDDAPGEGAQ